MVHVRGNDMVAPDGNQGVVDASVGEEAQRLADAIKAAGGDLGPVYVKLDTAIEEFERSGYRPGDLLPISAESGLSFSLREKRNGRTLWEAIVDAARDRVCSADGEIRKTLSSGGPVAASSLVALIVTDLGLPPMALPIAVAIAGSILAVGLTGFCEWTSSPADEH